MITYEVKINGVLLHRFDVRRVHALNEEMDKSGYLYKFTVYDYENEAVYKGEVKHKRQDTAGKLLDKVQKELLKKGNATR